MIIPRQREPSQNVPCCENLRPIYPPQDCQRPRCRPRRRRTTCYVPPPVAPIIIAPPRYLDLPPIPVPPPKPPRNLFDIGYITEQRKNCPPICPPSCPEPESICECVDCCEN